MKEAQEETRLDAVSSKDRGTEEEYKLTTKQTGTMSWAGGKKKKACLPNDRYQRVSRLRYYCTIFDSFEKMVGGSRWRPFSYSVLQIHARALVSKLIFHGHLFSSREALYISHKSPG